MKKAFFPLLILVALILGPVAPARAGSADGTEHVYAVAYSTSLCFDVETPHPDCHFADPVTLPNGRVQITGLVNVMSFTSSDPRWNAICVATTDPFMLSDRSYPIMGSFVCKPTDPTLGGWWEGSHTQVFQPENYIARFTAKGYGAFDGLMTISRNTMSAHPVEEIEIIELPGYEK